MPLIAATIGYLTKLVAVEMMFRPLEFKGIPPFLGWQGVMPRNTVRIAAITVNLMMDRLVDPQEIVDRIDVDDLLEQLNGPITESVDRLTREVMAEFQPLLWESMPEAARRALIARVRRGVPETVDRLVADMRENVDSVIDIRTLAVNALIRDKALTVKLVRTTGKNELGFIVKVGAPFGFILGLVQAITWALTHSTWIMPGFGALTGLLTDYLALQMIFRPVEPHRYLGFIPWQGLFHKRRAEVTEDYSRVMAEEILTPSNVIEAILTGPQSDRFLALITREVQRTIDAQTGIAKPLVKVLVGGERYQNLKHEVASKIVEGLRDQPAEVHEYTTKALDLPEFMTSKMKLMTDDEYEGLLRPAFKQDEWKLVTVGAVLGFLIGELQVHLLLS